MRIPNVDLNGTEVGLGQPTYLIAEIGQNHNGDIGVAKKLIDVAVRSGANAVKFQKRDLDSELTKEAFDAPYINNNSYGSTYGEHRRFLELNIDQHLELFNYSKQKNITYFCTPCDIVSVNQLEQIDCPFYKVASRDLSNIPLLERLSKVNKPIIISTGMADYGDIERALHVLNKSKDMLLIMQCTSEYPCKFENVNLNVVKTLENRYGYNVGFSDHTSGVIISAVAPQFGAVIIEKHITLDRTMRGSDHAGSLEESGLVKLKQYLDAIRLASGKNEKEKLGDIKKASEKLERSIVANRLILKGEIITEDMLVLKSPGTGLRWHQKESIVGRLAKVDIESDTLITTNEVI